MGFLFYTLIRVPASLGCSSVVEHASVRLSLSSLMPDAVRPFFWSSLASRRSPHPQCSWKALEHCLMSSRTHKGLALNVTCALFNLLTRDRTITSQVFWPQSENCCPPCHAEETRMPPPPHQGGCVHAGCPPNPDSCSRLALPCRHPLQGSSSEETMGHSGAEHPKLFASDHLTVQGLGNPLAPGQGPLI